jgi:hypothetical protein
LLDSALYPHVRLLRTWLLSDAFSAFTGSKLQNIAFRTDKPCLIGLAKARASSSSRTWLVSCFCNSLRAELACLAAIAALLRFGLVGLGSCAFAGFRLTVPRRVT